MSWVEHGGFCRPCLKNLSSVNYLQCLVLDWKPSQVKPWIVIILGLFFVLFFFLEQILYNIKQEYKRMQKRRHLENSFQQTDPCCSTDAQPHAFLLTGPALPGTWKILCNSALSF